MISQFSIATRGVPQANISLFPSFKIKESLSFIHPYRRKTMAHVTTSVTCLPISILYYEELRAQSP